MSTNTPNNNNDGNLLVDLDGTLAHYDGWHGIQHIGEPVPAMLDRVKTWIEKGRDVRIFTARVFPETVLEDVTFAAEFTPATWNGTGEMGDKILAGLHVREWCKRFVGVVLPITCRKDMRTVEIWDDRAVGVIPNVGISHETVPALALAQVCSAVGIKIEDGQEYARTADFVQAHLRRLAINAHKFRTALEDVAALVDGARDALNYGKPEDVLRACQTLQKATKILDEANGKGGDAA